jgi:integrase
MQLLFGVPGVRERAMVFLDMPSGLRRGELAGLKWEDFDFKNLHVSVTRSQGGANPPEKRRYAG